MAEGSMVQPAVATTGPGATWRNTRFGTPFYLAIVIALTMAVLSIASPHFLTGGNIYDLIEGYSVTLIFASGLLLVLVAGGIDISFVAVASVAQYAAGYAAARLALPAPVVIAIALATGTALGCVNAALIHYLKIGSIIVSVAMLTALFSFLMYVTGGRSIYNLPDWWTETPSFLANAPFGGLDLSVAVMVAVVVLTWFLLEHTVAGRQLVAMGGSPEAARRLGVSIAGMHFLAYGYLGFCAAIAGFIQAHRVEEVVPNAIVGTELNVLAAAVLGGARLMGGVGSVPGVVMGVLLLAILQNGLNLLGVSPYFFDVVIGVVILAATSITGLTERVRPRRMRARQSSNPETPS